MSVQYVSLEEIELQVEALREFIREEAAAETARSEAWDRVGRLQICVWQLEDRVRNLEKAVLRGSLLTIGLILAWLILEMLAG